MRAVQVKIHNFRSIHDAVIDLQECSLLAGANNAGKSNLIDAIRIFYNDLTWNESRDFPKAPPEDKEVWVEIEFQPSESELNDLKDEYRSDNDTFRVRRYFKTETGDTAKEPLRYYGYVNGVLSDNQFYGSKNVGIGKFGTIVYIPAVSKIDETTKLTGPSALRDLVATVTSKVLYASPAYQNLRTAFEVFETSVKKEESDDGHSLAKLESEITNEIAPWGTSFSLGIQSIQPNDIVKTLVKPALIDKYLGEGIEPARFGAGFQRHLVYTLIKLAARHSNATPKPIDNKKKEFSPSLTWILFEEPEAFLHPTQEDILYDSLLELIKGDEATQVLLTTHSSRFVSRSINNLTQLTRIRRDRGISSTRRISDDDLERILKNAFETDENIASIGEQKESVDRDAAMAAFKMELWMQPHRAASFFANRVVLVEGPTECALYSYLTSRNLMPAAHGVIFVDCMGKYNIHRFISLFGELGIDHAILYDGDNGKSKDLEVTNSINEAKNEYTRVITRLDKDIETELGIDPIDRSKSHRKPQYLLYNLSAGKVTKDRLDKVIDIFHSLCHKTQ